ncbi:unnamed protein product [Rhizophagus irregularis]|nr:unnamed protein product [Rhizophagus irregularis]
MRTSHRVPVIKSFSLRQSANFSGRNILKNYKRFGLSKSESNVNYDVNDENKSYDEMEGVTENIENESNNNFRDFREDNEEGGNFGEDDDDGGNFGDDDDDGENDDDETYEEYDFDFREEESDNFETDNNINLYEEDSIVDASTDINQMANINENTPYFENSTSTLLFCWIQKHNISTNAYNDLVDILQNPTFNANDIVKNIKIQRVYIYNELPNNFYSNARSTTQESQLWLVDQHLEEDMKRLEQGIVMNVLKEDCWIVAGLGCITADLPQGNDLTGIKWHGAIKGCRTCLVAKENATDENLDIASISRYHHITDTQFEDMFAAPTLMQRSDIAKEYGLRNSLPVLDQLQQLAKLQERTELQRNQVVNAIVRCWSIVAKCSQLAFKPSLTSSDYEELEKTLKIELQFLTWMFPDFDWFIIEDSLEEDNEEPEVNSQSSRIQNIKLKKPVSAHNTMIKTNTEIFQSDLALSYSSFGFHASLINKSCKFYEGASYMQNEGYFEVKCHLHKNDVVTIQNGHDSGYAIIKAIFKHKDEGQRQQLSEQEQATFD